MSPLDTYIKSFGGQTKFAAAIGVSGSTVQKWLRQARTGDGRLPDGLRIKEIELTLGIKDFRVLFPIDWPEV